VGYHLLYTDNHPRNPFSCVLTSDLYLPRGWAEDRARCREAGIPEALGYRPGWRIGIDQLERVLGQGVRFAYVTFDEEVGSVAGFWFELDRLGQRAIGEVKPHFRAWTTPPKYHSGRSEYAPHRVDDLARHSPMFRDQPWRAVKIKDVTRGPAVWEIKHAAIHLVAREEHGVAVPTDRRYWLIVARQPKTGEIKYFVSNAPLTADPVVLLRVGFSRWHVEKWFERAKQETGFGAFEVRTYRSLMRHWLISRLAMFFLARQTRRLRKKKSTDHAGASGRRGQPPGRNDLAPTVAILGGEPQAMCVSPTAQ
jgi:SRSO17 transposase